MLLEKNDVTDAKRRIDFCIIAIFSVYKLNNELEIHALIIFSFILKVLTKSS
jgi:hypothetical protein